MRRTKKEEGRLYALCTPIERNEETKGVVGAGSGQAGREGRARDEFCSIRALREDNTRKRHRDKTYEYLIFGYSILYIFLANIS